MEITKITPLDESLVIKMFDFFQNDVIKLSNGWQMEKELISMRIIEDTTWAIQYYLEADHPRSHGGKYLYLYGLLQALVLQQDAICSLSEALFKSKISFNTNFPDLSAVRNLRNEVAGHPIDRDNTFISNFKLTKDNLSYTSEKEDKRWTNINLFEHIDKQNRCVNTILSDIIAKIGANLQ